MINIFRLLSCLWLVMLVAACSPKLKYVVYRDIPRDPAFTVVSASYTIADSRFRSEIESYLVKLGLSVIDSPLAKQPMIDVKSKAQQARSDGQLPAKIEAVSIDDLVDTKIVYDSTNADYVILVNAQTDVLKITRQSTREIQAIIEYSVLDKAGSRYVKLHDVLMSLGFKIKTMSEEQKVKMEYPLKEKGLMRY